MKTQLSCLALSLLAALPAFAQSQKPVVPEFLEGIARDHFYQPINCRLNIEDSVVIQTLDCVSANLRNDEYTSSAASAKIKSCLENRVQRKQTTSPNSYVQAAIKHDREVSQDILSNPTVENLFARLNGSPRVQACQIRELRRWNMERDKTKPYLLWHASLYLNDAEEAKIVPTQIFKTAEDLKHWIGSYNSEYEAWLMKSPANYRVMTHSARLLNEGKSVEAQYQITSRWTNERPSDLMTAEQKSFALYDDEVHDAHYTDGALDTNGNSGYTLRRGAFSIGNSGYAKNLKAQLDGCMADKVLKGAKKSENVAQALSAFCQTPASLKIFLPLDTTVAAKTWLSDRNRSKRLSFNPSRIEASEEEMNAEVIKASGIRWRPTLVNEQMVFDFNTKILTEAFPNEKVRRQAVRDFYAMNSRLNVGPIDGVIVKESRAAITKRLVRTGQLAKLFASLQGLGRTAIAQNDSRIETIGVQMVPFQQEISCTISLGIASVAAMMELEELKNSKQALKLFPQMLDKHWAAIPKSTCAAQMAQAGKSKEAMNAMIKTAQEILPMIHVQREEAAPLR